MLIRSAKESDIPFVLEGHFQINRHAPMGADKGLTAERIRKDILIEKPQAFIDIVEIDGKPVAFNFYCYTYFASTGQVLWVTNIYVDPFVRRKGITSAMLKHMQEAHPECAGIYGVTERDNHSAHSAFQANGAEFQPDFLFMGIAKAS